MRKADDEVYVLTPEYEAFLNAGYKFRHDKEWAAFLKGWNAARCVLLARMPAKRKAKRPARKRA